MLQEKQRVHLLLGYRQIGPNSVGLGKGFEHLRRLLRHRSSPFRLVYLGGNRKVELFGQLDVELIDVII